MKVVRKLRRVGTSSKDEIYGDAKEANDREVSQERGSDLREE